MQHIKILVVIKENLKYKIMKTKALSILTIFVFLLSSICVNAQNEKQVRDVPSFNKIDLRIAGDVFIKQESTQKLEVSAPDNVINDLITEVSGNTLVIKFNKWKVNYKNVEIYISVAELEGLDVSGSGSIVAQNKITTDEIDFEVSGSGKIKIENLAANDIEADISGSGKISLEGDKEANSFDFEISGSGDINTSDLPVKNIEGEISGSGKANVHCTEKLEIDISGSGRVYYKGKPIVNADISGSGSVKRAN